MFLRILKYLLIGLVNGSKLGIIFATLLDYKNNHALSGDNKIKKMSMLRGQVWMEDDDEYDHVIKNSQRVLRLNDQYKNHPYAQEFTKGRNVMFVYGTYVLEGKVFAKFSLDDIWKLFQEDPLPNNASNFCRQIINCMSTWNYLQNTLDLPLNTEIIRQAHGLMMEDEEDVLVGEYRSHLHSQAIIFLNQPAILKDTWKTQFLDFIKLKEMIQLWLLQIYLETLSITIHLTMEMEEFVARF